MNIIEAFKKAKDGDVIKNSTYSHCSFKVTYDIIKDNISINNEYSISDIISRCMSNRQLFDESWYISRKQKPIHGF